MPRVHSTKTVIIVDDNDISQYCNDSNRERGSGTEDGTHYGDSVEVYDPTLLTAAFGCSGKYNSDAGGPRAVLDPLVGTVVNIKYRPEGTGSGLPQDSFDAVITKYVETAPIAGYRLWSLETQPTGPWDTTDQS